MREKQKPFEDQRPREILSGKVAGERTETGPTWERTRAIAVIVDATTNMVITGIRYELTAEDVEAFLDVRA